MVGCNDAMTSNNRPRIGDSDIMVCKRSCEGDGDLVPQGEEASGGAHVGQATEVTRAAGLIKT